MPFHGRKRRNKKAYDFLTCLKRSSIYCRFVIINCGCKGGIYRDVYSIELHLRGTDSMQNQIIQILRNIKNARSKLLTVH